MAMMIKQYDHLFKIVIVGSQGVGKSGIFLRFCQNNYFENYTATIGVDFKFKTLDVDTRQCKLQIWDTAGQERFRTITSAYYKGAHIILIVYDLSNVESFNQMENYWIEEVKNKASSESRIVIMGSKADLPRGIEPGLVQKLGESLGVKTYEVSSKTGEGVFEAFQDMARDLINFYKNEAIKKASQELRLAQLNDKRRRRCC